MEERTVDSDVVARPVASLLVSSPLLTPCAMRVLMSADRGRWYVLMSADRGRPSSAEGGRGGREGNAQDVVMMMRASVAVKPFCGLRKRADDCSSVVVKERVVHSCIRCEV